MSKLKFLKNFILNPASTGAILPTGPHVAKELIRNINENNLKNIVEIGPGTGAITSFIIEALNENHTFFAVELNTEFYDHIRELYPEITVYNDNAANLPKILKKEKIKNIDAIISGLPWASFPPKIQISILDAIYSSLKPNGYFSTFAYLQGLYLPTGVKFKKLLKEYFTDIKISQVVWKNIPPAIVYHCKKN